MTVPDTLDPHGGTSADDLAAWYLAAVREVTDQCAEGAMRPSQVQVCSWLFGVRSVVVGFPDSDTASVDQLGVGAWELGLDPAPPPGLYQRTGQAVVGYGDPVTVTVYCADPETPPAVFEPAAAEAPLPAEVVLPVQAAAPATETHMLAPPASAAP